MEDGTKEAITTGHDVPPDVVATDIILIRRMDMTGIRRGVHGEGSK
jgi:hypothetical protein